MKRTILDVMAVVLSAGVTLALPALAAVAEGENLLVNSRFDAEKVAFLEFWTPSFSIERID